MARGLKASLTKHLHNAKQTQIAKDKQARALELKQKSKQKNQKKKLIKWVPFDSNDLVILLGEGDFSFAVSILQENLVEQIIATAYDSKTTVLEKYEATAPDHLEYLESDMRAQVLYDVDATALNKSKELIKRLNGWKAELAALPESKRDKKIVFVFNFPHLGTSISDQERNIAYHQNLLQGVFQSAKSIGPVHLVFTVFEGQPYDSWEIKRIAREQEFKLARSGVFNWNQYPGYQHALTAKQGNTNKVQKERAARVYLFQSSEAVEKSKDSNPKPKSRQTDNNNDDDDDDDDDWN